LWTPVLRFYAWSAPTISLGYFQELADVAAQAGDASDLPVVRRTTGGGAILHDLEITYSLTLPVDHPLIAGRPNELYRIAHRAVIAAVGSGARFFSDGVESCDAPSRRGPFFCFARRHGMDVVVDRGSGVAKLAGSAQRRTTTAILQHGSIILDSRFACQPVATWASLGGPSDFDPAAARLAPAFADALRLSLIEDRWRSDELALADRFVRQYAGDEWTRDRRRMTDDAPSIPGL
jgi:lipoate-protein ligase A